ncbi:MAG: hypothetical protein AB7K86_18355 [Rhodospirillales bacterium]
MWQGIVVGVAVALSAGWLVWAAVLPARWKRAIAGGRGGASGCGDCRGCAAAAPRRPGRTSA